MVEGRLYPRGDKGNSVRPHYRHISTLLSITERAIEKATELSSLNEDRYNIGGDISLLEVILVVVVVELLCWWIAPGFT